MNLKDLFDKAENGTLTFAQFEAAMQAANAKFVDLSEGNYVAKQKYTDDLAARDTRITTLDDTIKSRDTDLANLRQQLEAAGTDTEKLGKLTNDFAALQSKYDNETKAYEKQLREQAYKFAVREFTNQHKFTSQAAKREFERAMLEKKLPMENDVIVGATDFVTAYTKDNADSFVVEQPAPPSPADPNNKPHFVEPTTPNGSSGGNTTPFQFNFTGIRQH